LTYRERFLLVFIWIWLRCFAREFCLDVSASPREMEGCERARGFDFFDEDRPIGIGSRRHCLGGCISIGAGSRFLAIACHLGAPATTYKNTRGRTGVTPRGLLW
jgi:hypothetical protein